MGLPLWLSSKESAFDAGGTETCVQSLGQQDPLEEKMATHSEIWPGKSQRQRSLVGYSSWHCKELDT